MCYAYAEDEPSCSVIRRIVAYQNAASKGGVLLGLRPGFPENKRGYGDIKLSMPSVVEMTNKGLCTLVLTDLDKAQCVLEFIGSWLPKNDTFKTLGRLWFRVAVREVESWLLADRKEFSKFLKVAATNLSKRPDELDDPKQHLMNIVRAKCRKKRFRDMLPTGGAHIGTMYNSVLVEFIDNYWDPDRAALNSPSLRRALEAIKLLQ